MDAGLFWTAVGSASAAAGVVVAVVQGRARRAGRANVTAELGIGQLDETGDLSVTFASGKSRVMTLSGRKESDASAEEPPDGDGSQEPRFGPVNVIQIHNQGDTDVTISRCQYISNFGGVAFTFEPQVGASTSGDLLPKRLTSGEESILLHNLLSMRVFLNHVLLDNEVDCATFDIVLMLGNGQEIVLPTSMHARVDMSEDELDASGFKLTRRVLPEKQEFAGLSLVRRRR